MAHLEFGTRERALLITLMTLGGSASNPQLRERIRDALDGAPRRRMNELGLVKSEKHRAFHHELTDAGWAWCVEELAASPPAQAGSLGKALYCVLPAIRRYLDRADISLAEFIVPDAENEDALEARIRTAYWGLVKEPQEWVLLTDVRPLLGNASRADVDAELQRMERLPDVHLAPEADQKALSAADRDASVRIGGKNQHLLAIEAQ